MNDTGRYPYFGRPPVRQPKPASEAPTLRGKRVVLSTPDGFVYDVRAVSERYETAEGVVVVDVVTEEDYYRWMFGQAVAPRETYPCHLVWVEF